MTRICIAGMHRSGTSLIAGALGLAGVDLGPEDDLMPAKDDNPKGFFENLEVVQVNDDLLAQLGGSWQDPPLQRDGWHLRDDIQVYRRRIRALVEQHFGAAEHVAWKDPRISLLLPVWVPDAGIGEVVLVLRDPREVVQSVMARSNLDEFQAARLWTRYTVSLLHAWPRPTIVEYERFLDDPVTGLQDLCDRLSLPPPQPESHKKIRDLADPSLRHHVSAPVAEGPDMHQAIRLLVLLRHDQELARVEAQQLRDEWLRIAEDEPPEVQRLQITLSVLRERIQLKDEQLLVLEQTVDELQDRVPPAAPEPSGLKQRLPSMLKHAAHKVAALPRGGG